MLFLRKNTVVVWNVFVTFSQWEGRSSVIVFYARTHFWGGIPTGRREKRSCGQRYHRISVDGLQRGRPKILRGFDLLIRLFKTNVIFITSWVNACLWCDYVIFLVICITLFLFSSMLFFKGFEKLNIETTCCCGSIQMPY